MEKGESLEEIIYRLCGSNTNIAYYEYIKNSVLAEPDTKTQTY